MQPIQGCSIQRLFFHFYNNATLPCRQAGSTKLLNYPRRGYIIVDQVVYNFNNLV